MGTNAFLFGILFTSSLPKAAGLSLEPSGLSQSSLAPIFLPAALLAFITGSASDAVAYACLLFDRHWLCLVLFGFHIV